MSAVRVSELWRFPVKSCRGERVASAELGVSGLRFDRRWMLVDEAGRFVTLREVPELTRFQASVVDGAIRVRAHDGDTLLLPELLDDGERLLVGVWDDTVSAIRHEAGSAFFSSRLGRAVSLVCMPDDALRPVDPKRARADDRVSFADGYPLLLVSQESLDALNAGRAVPLEMERFRPNVVVSGAPQPFAEDDWPRFRIGDVSFRGLKPCARCVATTVDPSTGVRGAEPLRTLATLRTRGNAVYFGMNVVHDGPGLLRVGDVLEVVP